MGFKSELTIIDGTSQPDCNNVETTVNHIETTTIGTGTGCSTASGIASRFPNLESSIAIPNPHSDPFQLILPFGNVFLLILNVSG